MSNRPVYGVLVPLEAIGGFWLFIFALAMAFVFLAFRIALYALKSPWTWLALAIFFAVRGIMLRQREIRPEQQPVSS